MFEWDEAKREATIAKHGIDFLDAIEVFSGPHLVIDARSDVEQRRCAIGKVEGKLIAVFFTERDGTTRIVTARRARRNEREEYYAHVAGRGEAPRQQD